ncbi:rod shape-determining protein MreD [Paenibacillus sp. GCM10027626]|uniref:rod shape-determining protein MreD n=1 Tax=Paenibacillus sp. GCM10027626 TaxID=3273411 RepID=UPI0036382657
MSMQRIVAFMLLLFFSEGSLFYWLLPDSLVSRVVPHFTFAFVLFAALYRGRHTAVLLGLFFGLLQDAAFYGNIIGVHSFAMAVIGYLVGLTMEKRRSTMLMGLSVIVLSTLVYETIIYYIYRLFRLTHQTYEWALMDHILPSLFLQFGFALIFYIPARRWYEGSIKKKVEEEEE